MKKFLVGCLVVVVVLFIGGGMAGYFFVIKPGWDLVKDAGSFATEFQTLNSQVEETSGYTPPADGDMEPAQLERYLATQRDMRGELESQIQVLDEKWKEIQQDIRDQGRDASITEIATAYRDLGGLLLEAKRSQVAALNRHDFSLEEYVWVRNQAYRALGEEVAVAMAAMGDQGDLGDQRQVSDEVIEMVSKHREELMENHLFAWFGL